MKKAPKALTPFGSFFVWICWYYTVCASKKSNLLLLSPQFRQRLGCTLCEAEVAFGDDVFFGFRT